MVHTVLDECILALLAEMFRDSVPSYAKGSLERHVEFLGTCERVAQEFRGERFTKDDLPVAQVDVTRRSVILIYDVTDEDKRPGESFGRAVERILGELRLYLEEWRAHQHDLHVSVHLHKGGGFHSVV